MHTGYAPPQTVAAPHLGSVIARTLAPQSALPAFIDIGQRFDVGKGGVEGLPHGGFSRQRIRAIHHPFPEQALILFVRLAA